MLCVSGNVAGLFSLLDEIYKKNALNLNGLPKENVRSVHSFFPVGGEKKQPMPWKTSEETFPSPPLPQLKSH